MSAPLGKNGEAPLNALNEVTPEEATQIAEETILSDTRIAQILTRGRMQARVQAILDKLPSDRHGFFARNTADDINQYIDLGYRVETGLAIKGVHGTGDGKVVIGDLVLMTTSHNNFEAIRRVETKLVREKLDLAEHEYLNTAETNKPIVPFSETRSY